MKHKHADLIHAWADGAEIQFFCEFDQTWIDCKYYISWCETCKYRIKPQAEEIKIAKECYDKIEKENAYLMNKNDFLLAVIKEKETEIAILRKASEK